ncbi:glycosyltransferase family 2 protein [Gordonia hongkongensis]|uniref:glycosyltransferase family 2 protein n=1 Tax=Gordonia hongkongensis TaxID=1701090 RepID=UPI003D71BB0F
MTKSVTAVVRCLNEVDHIERLVTGMRAQSVPVDELIFVDSGSTDGTLELIERFGDIVVHIERSEFSFGRSLNRGISAASGDLVLVCSAHVYPSHDDWVEQLRNAFDDDTVAYAYGRQIGDHRTKFSEERVMRSWFPPTSIDRQPHPFANNANSMLRRDVWATHGFDETLTGLEDVAWASYVQSQGYAVSYRANAPVYHVHEEDWTTVRNRYRREAIAYKRIFPDSGMTVGRAGVLFGSSVIMDSLAAVRNQRRVSPSDIVMFRANQFFGAWKGFADDMPDAELLSRFYYPRRTGVKADTLNGRILNYDELDIMKVGTL